MSEERKGRVAGLDTIRFLAALIVVFGHGLRPDFDPYLEGLGRVGAVALGVVHNLFSGPAAVIVFFVISGFCIHYPYSGTARLEVWPFWTRRLLRIIIPAVMATAAMAAMGQATGFQDSILWSLICELIYYLAYPALRLGRDRFGWRKMIAVSLLAGFAIAATDPLAGGYPSFGAIGNALLGLPCWLVGCELAERLRGGAKPLIALTALNIWLMRAVIYGGMVVASILRFHTPLGYPWTLNIYSLFVGVWLFHEILWLEGRKPWLFLERAGEWSYSLYLVHIPLKAFVPMLFPVLAPNVLWAPGLAFVLAGSYAFYVVVERPGHRLAKNAARWIAARSVSRGVVSQPGLAPGSNA